MQVTQATERKVLLTQNRLFCISQLFLNLLSPGSLAWAVYSIGKGSLFFSFRFVARVPPQPPSREGEQKPGFAIARLLKCSTEVIALQCQNPGEIKG